MPPRASPCRREAVEAVLEPFELRFLRDACRLLQVPPDRWPHVPALERCWTTVAAARLAERLELDEGLSSDEARTRAAVRLGLDPSTLGTRLWRARDFGRRGSGS